MCIGKYWHLKLKHGFSAVLFLFAGIGYVGGNCRLGDTAIGHIVGVEFATKDIALEKSGEETIMDLRWISELEGIGPGDTVYIYDTLNLKRWDFERLEEWFFPQQLEIIGHGNTTIASSTWYSRYSPFGQFTEKRSIAGLGILYRITHFSGLNQYQNVMRWNSEFALNVDLHNSQREFDRGIFGDYDYPNYYDGLVDLNYVKSNSGVTYYSSLWLMPEYRLCVRFSDFRENKGRFGIEGSIGVGFVGNRQLRAHGSILEQRDYYKFDGINDYQYQYSVSDGIDYSLSQASIDYPKYDGCLSARGGMYYLAGKSMKFSTGVQITSTAMGAETTDLYFRVHYLLGERNQRKEAFEK